MSSSTAAFGPPRARIRPTSRTACLTPTRSPRPCSTPCASTGPPGRTRSPSGHGSNDFRGRSMKGVLIALLLLLLLPLAARAEVTELRITRQPSILYLGDIIMEQQKLVE